MLENQDALDNEVESICIQLEKAFSAKLACECCASPLDQRCHWCTNACGWHRCQKLQVHNAEEHVSFQSTFRWRPLTLHGGNAMDVDVCVLHMLDRVVSEKKIKTMLEDLRSNDIITNEKFKELLRLVIARTGGVIDDASVFPEANQQLIMSRADALSAAKNPEKAKDALDVLEDKLQSVWDFDTRAYWRWQDVRGQTGPPSQYTALQQVKYRMSSLASSRPLASVRANYSQHGSITS